MPEAGKLAARPAHSIDVSRPPDLIERLAHDLNNALTSILGHCDLLERGALSSSEAIWQIKAAAESAAALSRQLAAVETVSRNGATECASRNSRSRADRTAIQPGR